MGLRYRQEGRISAVQPPVRIRGLESEVVNNRSPRPRYGRAGNYEYRGSLNDGRLQSRIGGFKHFNS